MAHVASQYRISILTAQLWEYFTHTVTQMITDYFNAICSFFAFMDFGKLIDINKLARKFEGRNKWRSWESKTQAT